MEHTADLYLSDGIIRVITRGTTSIGCPVWNGPVYFLKETDSPEEIGDTAMKALGDFKEKSIPHPTTQEEWKVHGLKNKERLQLPSSWRAFLKKGAKSLLLKENKNTITIIPSKNLVAANGKSGLEASFLENKIRTCSADPEELGKAILEAFNDCE